MQSSEENTQDAAQTEQKQASAEGAAQTPAPKRRRRSAWWRLYFGVRAVCLIALAPVLMVAVGAFLLIGQEVTAPSWIVRDVEARAEAVLAGGSLGFGDMKITVGKDLHPRLVLRDAVLRDADGGILAEVPRIDGLLSPRGALKGRVLAQEIEIEGAQIALRRASDGSMAFAFRQGGAELAAADGFIGLLEQVDAAFEVAALEALEAVRAEGVIINYTDARAGRSWVIDGGRIALDVSEDDLALRADIALLSGRSYVTSAELSYDSPRGSSTASLGLRITDAAAPDIASQAPILSWLGVLDAPISGSMRGELDDSGVVSSLSATLQIGAGELQPTAQTKPIPFQSAQTYLSYDPVAERLSFDLIEIDTALGRVSGAAQTYLRDYTNGRPETLLGQVSLSEVTVLAQDMFDRPIGVTDSSADFRLRLDPFTLDIGEAVFVADEVPVLMRGRVRAATDGWTVSLDAQAEAVQTEQVLAYWPEAAAAKTRGWLGENLRGGTLRDVSVAFRGQPEGAPQFALSSEFRDAEIGFMRTMPPIEGAVGTLSIVGKRLALELSDGHVAAPQGGRIGLAGSTFVIPQTGPRAPAEIDLELAGGMTAVMSVLNLEPFGVLKASDLPVSFVQGRAQISAAIRTPLGRDVTPQERSWRAVATVRDVRSEVLVPGQVLTASRVQVQVDPESLVVSGPMRIGGTGGTATFSRALGPGSEGTARVVADVTIGPAFLETFNVNLPSGMVTGEGPGRIALDLSDPAQPDFTLTSNLQGIGLSLAGVGWSKARSQSGSLTIEGRLGGTPRIDRLAVSAPGLETSGSITLAQGGGLQRAAFERVRLGGWLNAPVVLVGRGQGRAAEVQIAGGTLDLRSANFGGTGGGGRGGQGGPMEIALDRLRITDSIFLDNFRGSFSSTGGFQGDFTGDVNGGAPVRGTLVPVNGGSAVRIDSDDAGALLRATGLIPGALNGRMQLTLIPTGAEGTYDGTVVGRDLRVQGAPALASLLDAVSVVGLITQLDGQGLMFRDVDAKFRLTPARVIVTEASAVGPSIGISLDGIYNQVQKVLDFQGVVSPFYLVNGIGAVFTRRGEGLIGFNFNLRGAVDNPQVSVNPLSALTPGMFREIFRRAPPTVEQ